MSRVNRLHHAIQALEALSLARRDSTLLDFLRAQLIEAVDADRAYSGLIESYRTKIEAHALAIDTAKARAFSAPLSLIAGNGNAEFKFSPKKTDKRSA